MCAVYTALKGEYMIMVEVKQLVKNYAGKTAVNGISFKVEDGEILGFLGPNGAGKSTTMNIITGYISSTSGTVTIDGYEILKNPIKARSKIGYLPEQPPLYLDMTVKGYLDFVYRIKKVKKNKREHIESICDRVGITDVYGRTIKKLSKGYKQRVGIAQALIGDPPVIILDEPSVGLDPKQIIGIRNLIKTLAENHTVILSSHILPEIQAVCSRVIVINNGKLVADGAPGMISGEISESVQTLLQIEGDIESVKGILTETEGIQAVNVKSSDGDGVTEYVVNISNSLNMKDVKRSIFNSMSENDFPILEMRNYDNSLEDVFLKLTDSSNLNTEETKEDEGLNDGQESLNSSGDTILSDEEQKFNESNGEDPSSENADNTEDGGDRV